MVDDMRVSSWSVIPGNRFYEVQIVDLNGVKSRHGSFVSPEGAAQWAREHFITRW